MTTLRTLFPARTLQALLLAAIGAVAVNAQTTVNLTFTGGGGTPLTISWAAPITFTAGGWGSASGGAQPFFVFAGVGDVYSNIQHATVVATSPSYTGIDGTGTINNIFSGQNFNDVHAADVVFTSYSATSTTQIAPGATFILEAGSLTAGIGVNPTTGNPYFGTLPANGTYTVFVTDADYQLTPVPEPSTYAAIFGALALAAVIRQRRRRISLAASRA